MYLCVCVALVNTSLPIRRSTRTITTKVTGETARCTAWERTGDGKKMFRNFIVPVLRKDSRSNPPPSCPQVCQRGSLRRVLPGQHASRSRHAAQRQAQHLLPQRLHRPVAAGQEDRLRRLRWYHKVRPPSLSAHVKYHENAAKVELIKKVFSLRFCVFVFCPEGRSTWACGRTTCGRAPGSSSLSLAFTTKEPSKTIRWWWASIFTRHKSPIKVQCECLSFRPR